MADAIKLKLEPKELHDKEYRNNAARKETAMLVRHIIYGELDDRVDAMEKAGPCPWQTEEDKKKGGLLPFSIAEGIVVAILSFLFGMFIRSVAMSGRTLDSNSQNGST